MDMKCTSEHQDINTLTNAYYSKLETVFQLQKELAELKTKIEELNGPISGSALPTTSAYKIRYNKTADLKEYMKQYYEKIKSKPKNTYTCEVCNCEILISSKKSHELSKKHNQNIQK